jgi:predicted transcriptional regulator
MAVRSDIIGQKRVLFDIIAELLAALREQQVWTPTRLAYRCKLDSRTSTKYVNYLLEVQFAVRINGKTQLQMTDRGREFLHEYMKLIKMLQQESSLALELEV